MEGTEEMKVRDYGDSFVITSIPYQITIVCCRWRTVVVIFPLLFTDTTAVRVLLSCKKKIYQYLI